MEPEILAKLVNVFRFVEWIKVIAITGGPCAGKSTFLKMAIKLLEKFGFKVIVVPEVARELISSGIFPWDTDWKKSTDFQKHVIFNILEKEASFFRAILDMDLKGKKVVFLCDRGIPDGAAYLGEENFRKLLLTLGTTFADTLERYDGVIHLVTVADGKPEFYKQDEERHETPEQAIVIDKLLQKVWHDHRHFLLVDNTAETFGEKINTALLALMRLLPMPTQQEIELKYKITGFDLAKIPPGTKSSRICQIYLDRLDKPGIECRVREKITDGVSTYVYTEKVETETEGIRGETEDNITQEAYEEFLTLYSNPRWKIIEKTRYKVPHNGHLLEIDVFDENSEFAGLVLGECEFKSVEEMNSFVPPEDLGVWTNVTTHGGYSNASLSKNGLPFED